MSFELIPALNISASGLQAERARMRVSANNLANANSTNDVNGGPYRRRELVFQAAFKDAMSGGDSLNDLNGVKIESMATDDKTTPLRVYAPYHPNADAEGMVDMPNIQPINEMVDMISATRSYEANLAVIKQSKEMAKRTIELGKG